jgi:leader peptidase (prepilin peptidase)/N-methyltransferase
VVNLLAAGWAELALYVLAGLGLILGSFAGCLACRLPRGESVFGRSHCENCNHQLEWYDLIPLLSFIYTLGKCRKCKHPIGWQTLLSESIGGLLGLVAWWLWGSNPIALLWLVAAIFITLWGALWLLKSYLSPSLLLISLILLLLLAVMSQMTLALTFVFSV